MSKEDKSKKPDSAQKQDAPFKRRPFWQSTAAAWGYLSNISGDKHVKQRISDRLTGIALFIAAILTILTLVVRQLAFIKFPLSLFCDGLVGVMLFLYLFNRFGILSTLSPRQAILTWQLIVVSCIIGIFLTFNLGVFGHSSH